MTTKKRRAQELSTGAAIMESLLAGSDRFLTVWVEGEEVRAAGITIHESPFDPCPLPAWTTAEAVLALVLFGRLHEVARWRENGGKGLMRICYRPVPDGMTPSDELRAS